MCLGGGASAPADNSGAIAQQQEAQRQATITQDLNAITQVYGGTAPANQPANSSTITWLGGGTGGGGLTPGAYYEANTTTPGKGYAVYDANGNVKMYSSAPPTASGSNQQPGGTVTGGPTTNVPGQFDDAYYNNIGNQYTSYYDPQLSDQYQNALNSLTLQLGQQGILQSSEGDRQLANLQKQYTAEQQSVASNSLAAENSAKQQVASQKAQLIALANTAADPSAVASQVSQSAASAVSPTQFSPLANVFTGLLGQGTNALAIQSGALPSAATGGSFVPTFSNTAALGGGSSGSSGGGSQTLVGG